MAPKKGENSKKAAGNAKKAEVAAQKAQEEDDRREAAKAADWARGTKSTAKKDAAADKAAEAARKKAEKDALLKAEEDSMPSKPKGAGTKTAQKKNVGTSRGTLDLSQLDPVKGSSLNASGIDNALDALSLANTSNGDKIDKHPERRFKAAYAAFEERRLDEMKDEKGLRRQQKVDQIRKEFEKSPENPFNQELVGTFDMTKEQAAELREQRRAGIESRLGN